MAWIESAAEVAKARAAAHALEEREADADANLWLYEEQELKGRGFRAASFFLHSKAPGSRSGRRYGLPSRFGDRGT